MSLAQPVLALSPDGKTVTWKKVDGALGYTLREGQSIIGLAPTTLTYPAKAGATYTVEARGKRSAKLTVPPVTVPPAPSPSPAGTVAVPGLGQIIGTDRARFTVGTDAKVYRDGVATVSSSVEELFVHGAQLGLYQQTPVGFWQWDYAGGGWGPQIPDPRVDGPAPTPPPTAGVHRLGTAIVRVPAEGSAEEKWLLDNFDSFTLNWFSKPKAMTDETEHRRFVEWTAKHGKYRRDHCYFWPHHAENNYPGGSLAQCKTWMEERCKQMGKFPQVRTESDVFNEVYGEDGKVRSSAMLNSWSSDYMAMLRYGLDLAKQYAPTTPRTLNDYGIIEYANAAKRAAFCRDAVILAKEKRLEQVGIQGHPQSPWNVNAQQLADFEKPLRDAGLKVVYTELGGGNNSGVDPLVTLMLGSSADGQTWWGPDDARTDVGAGSQLFVAVNQPKPPVARYQPWRKGSTTPAPEPEPVPTPTGDLIVGVDTRNATGWQLIADLNKQLGAKHARFHKPDDAAMQWWTSRGFTVLPIIDNDTSYFTRYPTIKAFEDRNEPYWPSQPLSPGETAQKYKAAAQALRNARGNDGSILLLAYDEWSSWRGDVLGQMLQAVPDLGQWITGIAIHPYCTINDPSNGQTDNFNFARIDGWHKRFTDRGINVPWMITEVGWSDKDFGTTVGHPKIAEYWRHLAAEVAKRPWITRVYTYQTNDQRTGDWGNREYTFGIFQANGAEKPAVAAVKSWIAAHPG